MKPVVRGYNHLQYRATKHDMMSPRKWRKTKQQTVNGKRSWTLLCDNLP